MLEAVEESVFCLLEVIEMMRCILLCMLEVAEVVCFVLEAVEVVLGSLEVLKVMRWMRRMLLPMPEAVEVAHLLLEAVSNMLHVLEMLEACAVCYFYMLEVVEGVCCVPECHTRCSPLLEVMRCCAKGHIALHRFLVFSHLHTYIAASHSLLV